MNNSNNLGSLIKTYEENKKATTINTIIGFAVLALVPVMIVLFLGEEDLSFNKVLFGLSAIFAAVGGSGAIWSSVKNHGARVSIHEHGLAVEKAGKNVTARWNEIAAVTEKIEKIYADNQYIYDRYNYKIETTGGETFELSNLISNIDEIGRQIKEKTFENLYSQLTDKINGGEQIAFGSVRIDKSSLYGIPWSKLSAIKLKEGTIEIKDRTSKTVITGDYGAIPNAFILMELLKERLKFE